MKNKNNDEILRSRIEAALYASGRPLRPNELAKAAGIKSNSKAIRLTKLVEEDINKHLHAVQVVRLIGDKFVMQLKPKYGNIAKVYVRTAGDSTPSSTINLEPTIIAITLGAQIIERHITLDHKMWGTDQKSSLEVLAMDMLKKRVNDISVVIGKPEKSLDFKAIL